MPTLVSLTCQVHDMSWCQSFWVASPVVCFFFSCFVWLDQVSFSHHYRIIKPLPPHALLLPICPCRLGFKGEEVFGSRVTALKQALGITQQEVQA